MTVLYLWALAAIAVSLSILMAGAWVVRLSIEETQLSTGFWKRVFSPTRNC